jgi:hypothetical protein
MLSYSRSGIMEELEDKLYDPLNGESLRLDQGKLILRIAVIERIIYSDKFEQLDRETQVDLVAQREAMVAYANALGRRLQWLGAEAR